MLEKRLDYELNGHPVQIKRGARSARVNKLCFSIGADYYYLFTHRLSKTIHII